MNRVLIITAFLLSFSSLSAQQWNGSTNSSGQIDRIGNILTNSLLIGKYGSSLSGDSDPYQFASVGSGIHDLIFYGNSSSTLNLRIYDGSLKFGSTSIPNAEIFNNGSGYFNGSLGIGTSTPQQKLHVEKNGNTFIQLKNIGTNGSTVKFGSVNSNGIKETQLHFENEFGIYDHSLNTWRLKIKGNGNVGIGTIDPKNKLSVNGTIWAKEVKVSLTDGADWVFEEDYNLKPLNEVEAFVKENKHLPEIPSAEEMRENDLSLGEMNNKLLQKIEELTLYMIRLNKDMTELRAKNEQLEEEVSALKNK